MGLGGSKGGSEKAKESPQERALAEVAMSNWERYKTVFRPAEDKWLRDVNQSTGAEKAQVAGQAAGMVGDQADAATEATVREAAASGINPNSGRFQGEIGGIGTERAKATGKATAASDVGVDTRQLGRKMGVVAVGRGQATGAAAGLSELAQTAANREISNVSNRFLARSERATAVGQGAGMALGSTDVLSKLRKKKPTDDTPRDSNGELQFDP